MDVSGLLISLSEDWFPPPRGFDSSFRGPGSAFVEEDTAFGLFGWDEGDEENFELILLIHDDFLPSDGEASGFVSRGLCGDGCAGWFDFSVFWR